VVERVLVLALERVLELEPVRHKLLQ